MAEGQGTVRALDPKVLDRLSSLGLVARTVVEGFMAGQHRSPYLGSSVEFAQHREYVPGDELRRVDWKVFGRNDRLVVKQFVEETNLVCHLLVDASESMGYRSLDWSKLDYARWCAASIAHLVLQARDTAGLIVFDKTWRAKVPPGNGAHQLKNILDVLGQADPRGPTGVGDVIDWVAPKLKRRGIVCLFSDFFDEPERIVSGLRRLVHAGHEPILFQVLDPQETRFDFQGMLKLEGLEGAGVQKIDPRAIREAYLEELEKHTKELARAARALSIDFVPLSTEAGVDAALSPYLARRMARARGGRRT
ncbi:MAG: DUF58 domain-containing protein [Planctomycetota bacterium]